MDVAARASGQMMRAILRAVLENPAQLEAIAARVGVPPEADKSQVAIPRPALLWQELISATKNPHVTLLAAHRLDLTALGPLLPLLLKGRTLGTALHVACQFSSVVHDQLDLELATEGDETKFSLRAQLVSPARYLAEFVLALSARLMKQYVPSFELRAVRLPHDLVRPAEAYEEAFGCPVQGGAPEAALVFATDFLDASAAAQDEVQFDLLHQEAALLDSTLREDAAPAHRLEATYCALAGRSPEPDLVAARAGMDALEFQSCLQAIGRTHEEMGEWAKERVAKRLLCDDILGVHEISTRLGYETTDALVEDFHRWTGQAPDEWREEHGRAVG